MKITPKPATLTGVVIELDAAEAMVLTNVLGKSSYLYELYRTLSEMFPGYEDAYEADGKPVLLAR